jgi:hypothetical protein
MKPIHDLRHGVGPAAGFVLALLVATCAQTTVALAQGAGNDEYLRNTLPEESQIDDGNAVYRIVGGAGATPGAWPSMIGIYMRSFAEGRIPMCGGTVIDGRWVLTAAHCVYQKEAREFFIREGANRAGSGRSIDVSRIIVHEDYQHARHLNDVALMELATPATSPRQLLLRSDMRSELLADKTQATVIGYGVTRPGINVGSDTLLQVDLPLVSQARCAAALDSNSITDATVCAGTDEGGKDSCQGDSGGPLFVRDRKNQPLQVGVVSWGKGCAQPGKYGVYASVGYFEAWIRQRVANASFAPAREAVSPNDHVMEDLTSGSDGHPGGLAQVNIDLLPRSEVRVGELVTVRITSSVPGRLLVFNESFDGPSYQLFPNQFSGRNQNGQPRDAIGAGRRITIPGPTDEFALRIRPPLGKNRLVAVVMPTAVDVGDLLKVNEGMQPIRDLTGLLRTLAERETAARNLGLEPAAPKNRAIGTREYEIVQ